MTLTSGIDGADVDPFEEFNRAMGATGDESPYPDLALARASAQIKEEVFDIPQVEGQEDPPGLRLFTAYSYDAVQTVLGDEHFSSAGYAEVMGLVFGHSILEMDEPEHKSYRGLIQQAFTRKAMERWEDEVVRPLINRMIDEFVADGKTDLVRNLLFPFPVNVIAELIGLPNEDLPRFHRLAVELIGVTVDMDRSIAASQALGEYFLELIRERRGGDGPDLMTVLANATGPHGEHLTDDEILAFLRLLLPAGAETTYRSSSNLMFGLLSNPEQLDALRNDPSLYPQAIEEGIRWEPPLLLIMRTATADVDVCGVSVPEGAMVIVSLGAANHDETRWNHPERFDIFRDRKPHIGFAYGPHMCLGMHLARMETKVALEVMFERLPNLRLDPEVGEQFISGMTFRAPPRLDVVWD
jgi:cytochrome P450